MQKGVFRVDIGQVVDKFDNGLFDKHLTIKQFKMYKYDTFLVEYFEEVCEEDVVVFWCHMYKLRAAEFGEKAKLAILILCVSPDNLETERGVSVLNLQKTDLRNRLTEESLDAVIGVGLDTRKLAEFPFHKVA